jgi:hypothetical protein
LNARADNVEKVSNLSAVNCDARTKLAVADCIPYHVQPRFIRPEYGRRATADA